ncbi:hypothetical protein ACSLOD_28375, partial [Escherichia coli]
KRIEGKKQRRERNHRLFLAAGLLIEAGLVDTKTGELRYKKDRTELNLNGLNHRHVDFLWDSEHGQHRRKITHAPVIGGASAT